MAYYRARFGDRPLAREESARVDALLATLDRLPAATRKPGP